MIKVTLYAATTNPGKLREFAESASGAGVAVLPLPGLREMPEPVEDATTFVGNAELKAVAYSLLAPGMLVMADDSGLEVDALGGRPGVRSARFAEDVEAEVALKAVEPTSQMRDVGHLKFSNDSAMSGDARNNACLISLLHDVAAPRAARFVCALAVARDGEVVWRARGECVGEMLLVPRGENGFGYDPLFLLPELGQTMAELGREEKWRVSHRGKAFRELLATMKTKADPLRG